MININDVYQRVLLLANKEQRGYITPTEFNSFAAQAQLEIFESYFLKKFQAQQAPGSTEDYADVSMNVDEKISYFDNFFTQNGKTMLGAREDRAGYAYPPDFYRLDHVSVPGPTSGPNAGLPIMADEISHRDSHYVNLSPLTRPNVNQPVFIREEGGVILLPESYTGAINFFYVRRPVDPVWAQRVGDSADVDRLYPNGATDAQRDQIVGVPFYDSTASSDFELHNSEEHELVYRILYLAGVTIKQQDLVQFGAGKTSEITSTEE